MTRNSRIKNTRFGRFLWAWGLLAFAVAAATFAATRERETGQGADSEKALPVRTVVVEPVTSYEVRRVYTGTVMPVRAADLSWTRAGEITTVHVDQGDRVQAGALLAELDVRGLTARRDELTAQCDAAQAELDALIAGPRSETVAAARADLDRWQAEVNLQLATRTRRQTLLDQRAVSRADYDQAQFGLQSAEAQLEIARQKLLELEAGTRAETIRAQRGVVAQLAAAVAAVDVQLGDSRLEAPFDGTVTSRLFDEGAVVAAGQVAMRLVDDANLEAWFSLPVAAAGHLKTNSQYQVRVADRPLAANLKSIVPELDLATRTQRVVLQLERIRDTHALPGEVARIDVQTQLPVSAGYWLPKTALVHGSRGLWSCFVVVPFESADASRLAVTRSAEANPPSMVEKRDLQVVHMADDQVLVRGMLDEGDQVVAAGTHRVVPHQVVRQVDSQ